MDIEMLDVHIIRHSRHPHASGDPDFQYAQLRKVWVPAFAGMTDVWSGKK